MVKSTITKAPKIEAPFPKLMKAMTGGGQIVLFHKPRVGQVVHQAEYHHPVGYFCDSWNMGTFEDYDGSVILRNTEYFNTESE